MIAFKNISCGYDGVDIIKEFNAKVNDGEIILKVIQPEGKGKMDVSSYLNGLKNKEELLNKILR